jgi:hypothetical protein
MDDRERAKNGFGPGRVDRRLKLPATKSCEMCGWKMVRTASGSSARIAAANGKIARPEPGAASLFEN